MSQSVGAVALDIVAGKNTLNSTIKSAMGEAQNTANSGSSGIANALGKIGSVAGTVAKTVGAGMITASTAVVGLATSAVQSYADFEQLVGGVETLFGTGGKSLEEYAESVGKSVEEAKEEYDKLDTAQRRVFVNSANAFKTAGLSQNEYMETVTGFSASLIASLGGDTLKASELANQAIIDMADNANKMGSSMESIQNAYSGFAKQNYTMLDNLKLGYGGTKEEMARLLADATAISGIEYDISSYADVVSAINVIQTKMGITGTTAKEASETISGSIGMMKSSWQNLVTGLASGNGDIYSYIDEFVESVGTVADNLIPVIETALDGIVILIQELAPKIIEEVPKLISKLLPSVIETALSLVQAVVDILPDLVNLIVEQAPVFIDACIQIIESVIRALPVIVESFASALPTLLPMLISALVNLVLLICQVLPQIIQPIIDNLPMILEALIDAIFTNLPILVQGIIQLVVALVPMIFQVIGIYAEAIFSALSRLFAPVGEWLNENVINPIVEFFTGLWNAIKEIWDAISNAIRIAFQLIASIIDGAFQIITLPFRFIWENCKEYVFQAFEWIKEKIDIAIGFIRNIVEVGFGFVKEKIINPIVEVREKVLEVFEKIRTAISERITSTKSNVSNVFNGIKDKISTVVNAIRSVVSSVFNKVKDAMSKPMEKARDLIKGIIDKIKGFFDGMKLKFPDLKLPHFGISPKGWKIGDLLEGSIPKLSIDWYAKAMNNPMIMTKPTIFGYDAGAGKLLGGGESGSELVVGTNTLLSMIRSAVASVLGGSKLTIEVPALQNVRAGSSSSDSGLSDKLDRLVELFKQFIESGDADMTVPIYIGNDLIDEYILNKSNRAVLRSGGRA